MIRECRVGSRERPPVDQPGGDLEEGLWEMWECVTYLHRSCRRDKGTSTHFLSRWRIPRTRARNQTSLSSCPCRVSPPLSFGLQGVPCGPAPRRGPLVWPLLASSSPLCSAQSFPWCGVDQPGRGAARYSVETSLPLCCLVNNWTVLGGCRYRLSRSPANKRMSCPIKGSERFF